MRDKTVCFTGHRQLPMAEKARIAADLERTLRDLITKGYRYFGAGGALGFDTLAAETVLRLRKEFPAVRLILVLPCKDQAKSWQPADVAIYEQHKKLADRVVFTAETYFNGCMQKRNRHLVDNSSVCVAYLTAPTGGTAYTVRYAQKNGLQIINLGQVAS